MINTVRVWARKPSRVSDTSVYREAKQKKEGSAKVRPSFFQGFFKMLEFQADLVLKNIDQETK
ncbi:MAG: hypothetical protein J0H02_05600 [Armatimonadetes bacterium]|nr:hypothetical protein [Armatimonadota bacterium]